MVVSWLSYYVVLLSLLPPIIGKSRGAVSFEAATLSNTEMVNTAVLCRTT